MMKVIKFTKPCNQYIAGDIAGFTDDDAKMYLDAGVAEPYEYDGDIEQAPEMPGKPGGVKDVEANHATREEIEEAEKRTPVEQTDEETDDQTEAKSVDAPVENKLVKGAPKKK